MSEIVGLALQNLLSPAILFFVLGALAAAVRSDLEIPTAVGKGLSLYLIVAIGFKGGTQLAASPWTGQLVAVGVAAVGLSFLMPVLAYWLVRVTSRTTITNAAAISATYGSVSAVTFVTAAAFLTREGIPYAGYLVAALALMEAPAIVTGLILAGRDATGPRDAKRPLIPKRVLREALLSGSVVLLFGALLIGFMTGDAGLEAVGGVLVDPFQGVLALFLLEMGLIVVRRLRDAPFMGWSLVAFGLYMPVIGAAIGLALSALIGLSQGDATLLMVLAASGSYIAVPAAMRHALPKANPGLYMTLSLGVTFPFNVIVGIPVYYAIAGALLGA